MFSIFRFSVPVALPLLAVLLLSANENLVAQTRQKYRLLVAVTPAAYNNMGGANMRIQINNELISNSNWHYANSPILAQVELAGVVKINYTENPVSIDPDLDSLRVRANNPSNIISVLRTLYRADLVTMLEVNPDWVPGVGGVGGIGYINSPSDSAYTCLNYNAISYIPAADHEFGHNFGCRHDTLHDPTNTPYMYGHGYIMPNGDDGDIMSYPGTYQIWFSNPDSLFEGLPRGTVLRCNATRVHNERIGTIAGFFTTQNAVTVSGRTWKNYEYGDIMANDSITTSGVDSLIDTSEVKLRATTKVVINSGFYVARNAKLTVTTGSGALGKRMVGGKHDGGYKPPVAILEQAGFSATASILNNSLKICVSVPAPSPVSIKVIDLSGRLLTRKVVSAENVGLHTYILGLKDAMPGKVYFIKIETPLNSKVIKLAFVR